MDRPRGHGEISAKKAKLRVKRQRKPKIWSGTSRHTKPVGVPAPSSLLSVKHNANDKTLRPAAGIYRFRWQSLSPHPRVCGDHRKNSPDPRILDVCGGGSEESTKRFPSAYVTSVSQDGAQRLLGTISAAAGGPPQIDIHRAAKVNYKASHRGTCSKLRQFNDHPIKQTIDLMQCACGQ